MSKKGFALKNFPSHSGWQRHKMSCRKNNHLPLLSVIPSFLIVLLISVSGISVAQEISNIETKDMHLFHEGEFADIYFERSLYEKESSAHFFVKVLIKNKSNKLIGVDMVNDYWAVLYPNQYVVQDIFDREKPALEYQVTPDTLDQLMRDRVINEYHREQLLMIHPGKAIVYYRDFTAAKKKAVQIKKNEKLTLSFDGQLLITNGKTIEDVNCFNETNVNRFLMLNYPLKWTVIPPDALVYEKTE